MNLEEAWKTNSQEWRDGLIAGLKLAMRECVLESAEGYDNYASNVQQALWLNIMVLTGENYSGSSATA